MLAKSEGKLDALVNNAGFGLIGAFEDLTEEDCRRQLDTNLFGAMAVTRAVLPAMRDAERGRIVMISSNAVNAPHPMLSMYAASKWALEGWAEALAMEVAPFGVEIVVVQPGSHQTEFGAHVEFVGGGDSIYGPWMATVAPNMAKVGGWGREPAAATQALVDAVQAPDAPFRTALGDDAVAFAGLKAAFPYEARAWMMRAVMGIPSPSSLRRHTPSPDRAEQTTQSGIADHIVQGLLQDPSLVHDMVGAFGWSARRWS